VSFKSFFFDPGLRILAVSPDFDEVVAACASETFDRIGLVWGAYAALGGWGGGLGLGLGSDERAGDDGWCPGDGVAANGVAIEDVCGPTAVVYDAI